MNKMYYQKSDHDLIEDGKRYRKLKKWFKDEYDNSVKSKDTLFKAWSKCQDKIKKLEEQ